MADHTKTTERLNGTEYEVCLGCSEVVDDGNVVVLTLWTAAEANGHVPPHETE